MIRLHIKRKQLFIKIWMIANFFSRPSSVGKGGDCTRLRHCHQIKVVQLDTMFVFFCFAFVATANAALRNCYGDVAKLTPTGKYPTGNVVSYAFVQHDLPALVSHKSCYDASADRNCIQASVIAALASRESQGGTSLINGYGDSGREWGILRCNLAHSGLPCTSVAWNSCAHIEMMISKVLIPDIYTVYANHPTWTIDQALQGGVAAYDAGIRLVQNWLTIDANTTGNDYSNDVIARAKWLRANGWN
ncbi:unnamed protein product [Lymnaea stagnalis]|uniref:Lysozyme n=1 Tax=Lymnaea stagnalis TaxID=6523 RepID=A0AAV2H4M5_LYMST